MSTLGEFQELVNDIKDPELLDVAESLLRDMIEIQNMRERIEMLDEGLSKGDRAAFWFFAIGLDKEQVGLATNTVIGRKRFLLDQEQRRKDREESEKEEVARIAKESEPTLNDADNVTD